MKATTLVIVATGLLAVSSVESEQGWIETPGPAGSAACAFVEAANGDVLAAMVDSGG